MENNFYDGDREAYLASLSKKDVVSSLTIEDVERFLKSLGVETIERKGKNILICPTICHNPIDDPGSMKLYWYQDNKVFHCYTECGDSMSIFELYKRYMSVNNGPITDVEAEAYVKQFAKNIEVQTVDTSHSREGIDKEKYYQEKSVIQLNAYPQFLIDCFTHYYHPSWLREGISREAMDKFNIRFSINQNKIIIPHYDIDGRLVGIRGRAFNPEELAAGCKYMPVMIGDTIYTHQLHFNLYGIYQNKETIARTRRAVLVEGEKSVLKAYDFYGDDNIFVAVCGSNLNKYQVNILTKLLGVNEIIIALDKEYDDCFSTEGRKYERKLVDMCKKYANDARFSYIYDREGLLDKKDAPVDKGKEIWEKLYKERTKVR